MRGTFAFPIRAVSMLAGAVLMTVPAFSLSEQYETPPEQDPAVVLDGKELGPGYAVLAPVRSDGFLRIYELPVIGSVHTPKPFRAAVKPRM